MDNGLDIRQYEDACGGAVALMAEYGREATKTGQGTDTKPDHAWYHNAAPTPALVIYAAV